MTTPEDKRFNGLSAESESNRSPEFKAARDRLVTEVNEWLEVLAAKRDAGESLDDGTTISDQQLIVRTMLGGTEAGTASMMEEKQYGTAVIGDGVATPLELQAVLPRGGGSVLDTIEVRGSDPLERIVAGETYSPRSHNTTDVSFTVSEDEDGSGRRYFGYEVRGDGSVRRRFIDHQGTNITQHVRDVEDVKLATAAFAQVKEQVG